MSTLCLAMMLLIASCSDTTGTPTAVTNPTLPPSPTALPSAVSVALAFVDALNEQDYETVFELLDEPSRTGLDPIALEQNFAAERATATALSVSYQLRGGMLTESNSATTSLASAWETTLVGSFQTTGTMALKFTGNTWRVLWSRDLILPGLSSGTLVMRRDVSQRGTVYAADGAELATQTDRLMLGVRPSLIKDAAEEKALLEVLSQITGLTPDAIQARYARSPADWFAPIAELDEDTLTQHSAALAPFTAVSAVPNFSRAYPQSQIAPHVVGYVGPISPEALNAYRARGFAGDEQVGLSGVEGYMDSTLAGQPGGRLQLLRDDGAVELVAERPFVRGMDVTLTISPGLQLAVQSILGTRPGAAVVLDARDNAVLAMASYPTFDNAIFTTLDKTEERVQVLNDQGFPLVNRATQAGYPPGSTFKIVTIAAGISEGVAQPDEMFVDPGFWVGLGEEYRKTCWLQRGHGRISLVNGLSASCNVVFYEVGNRLDRVSQTALASYARRFGFGALTEVELTGELGGVVPDPDWKKATRGDVWTSGDTVNMAVGQGFMLVTPLQIAQMTAAVANGGDIRQPHVVARISGPTSDTPVESPVKGKLDLKPEVLDAIQMGMEGVIADRRVGTTVRQFATFDYYIVDDQVVSGRRLTAAQRNEARKLVVAGKSGTAQAPQPNAKPFAWFTAYAPADAPQIVVTLLLENIGEGSVYAAPLVRQIIEAYYGLPLSTPARATVITD